MATFTGSSFKGNAYFDQVVSGLQKVSAKPSSNSALNVPVIRSPWVMSTVEMLKAGEGILWRVNPSDIGWDMPQRSTLMKTMQGTVLHVWPKSGRNTFFDEINLTLNLQSGSIMPQMSSDYGKTVSDGIKNFNAFLTLYDSPKITKDGRPNYVIIKYHSHIFPDITLMGWLDPSGIKFNDTAAEPGKVESWSVGFTVLYTIPQLTNPQARILVNQTLDELQSAFVPQDSTDLRQDPTTSGSSRPLQPSRNLV